MKINIPEHITFESLIAFATSNNCVFVWRDGEYSMVQQSPNNNSLAQRYSTYSMHEMAKFLGIGSKTLFKQLRDEKILDQKNLPYQRYIDAGYFRVLTKSWNSAVGSRLYNKIVVTRCGYHWLKKQTEKSDT